MASNLEQSAASRTEMETRECNVDNRLLLDMTVEATD